MQPHNDDTRPEEEHPDGGRDTKLRTISDARWMALLSVIDAYYRPLHIVAEHGKPVSMGANVTGTGGAAA